MPMDAYRHGDSFYVHLDLPGIDADSISLTVEQNVLTVRAERAPVKAVDPSRPGGSVSDADARSHQVQARSPW